MLEQRGLDWTLERLRRAVILLRKSPPGPPEGLLVAGIHLSDAARNRGLARKNAQAHPSRAFQLVALIRKETYRPRPTIGR